MSTVATKPRARSRASAEPTLAEHISEMRAKLQQADRLLSQAWDACEESSTTDTLLRHLIEDLLPDTMMALKAEQLDQGITAKAYDDLFLPLALLDSIVTINAGQVLHATLAAAHMLLDQVHSSLDSVGWTQSLPEAPPASPPVPAEQRVAGDDAEAPRRLALAQESNHEIEKLAEGAIELLRLKRDDDFLMYHGILQRIVLLAQIGFFAMQLHGDGDGREQWADDAEVRNMERAYQGFYR